MKEKMFFVIPVIEALKHRDNLPLVMEFECFKMEDEGIWFIPELKVYVIEGVNVFRNKEDAVEYQINQIDKFIKSLTKKKMILKDEICEGEINEC